MATPIALVDSRDTWGGLRDGYRRAQPGVPTSTVGQPPQFRGTRTTPGQAVPPPKILASAARNNQGTNVCVPYARVTPADELNGKGRLNTGDVCFLQRLKLSQTGQVRMNMGESDASKMGESPYPQPTRLSAGSHPHASITRICGLDHVNRMLGPLNYKAGESVLVNSLNPADDWRELTVLSEWVLDGIVLSNDNPHFYMSTSDGQRNDQLFNVAIQGACQLNNGFEDYSGRGVAARHDQRQTMSAVGPGHATRATYDERKAGHSNGAFGNVASLIGGPFYDSYPLQMFDRKVRPLSELYIGLVCKLVMNTADGKGDLENLLMTQPLLRQQLDANVAKEESEARRKEGGPALSKTGAKPAFGKGKRFSTDHLHVFCYQPFSDRQIWQMWAGGQMDLDIVDDPKDAEVPRDRRGPLQTGTFDPSVNKDAQDADKDVMPRYRDALRNAVASNAKMMKAGVYDGDGSFAGIKMHEMVCLVGAWRLGKVLDTKSQRKDSYHGGPIDTSFSVTLNCDLSFLDWRALRRRLGNGRVGSAHAEAWDFDPVKNTFPYTVDIKNVNGDTVTKQKGDDGRVMHWPGKYVRLERENAEDNVPINPTEKDANAELASLHYRTNHPNELNQLQVDKQTQIDRYKERIMYKATDALSSKKTSDNPNGVVMFSTAPESPSAVGRKRVAPLAEDVAAATPPRSTSSVPVAASTPAASPLLFPGVQSVNVARKKRAGTPATGPAAVSEGAAPTAAAPAPGARAVRALGEDESMASIFNARGDAPSGGSAATGAPAGAPASSTPTDAPGSASRSFPRRSRAS